MTNLQMAGTGAITVVMALNVTPSLAQETAKVCLIVPSFANTSDWNDNGIGVAAGAELADLLFASGEFTVISDAVVSPILAELGAEAIDPFDETLTTAVAERAGCPYILTGRVSEFSVGSYSAGVSFVRGRLTKAEATIDGYLLNGQTGEIVATVEGTGSKTAAGGALNRIRAEIEADVGAARETLRPAVQELFEAVLPHARRLPPPVFRLSGNVVGLGREEGTVYIDRGQNLGVEVGQRFAVSRVVEEIRGTDGALLDQIIEQVGTVEVTRVMSQSAICRIVQGEAAEGDTVKVDIGA